MWLSQANCVAVIFQFAPNVWVTEVSVCMCVRHTNRPCAGRCAPVVQAMIAEGVQVKCLLVAES